MKETRADTRVALLQAAGLHVLLFALMFAGLQWTRSNVAEAAQGDVIEADLIDPSALSASMRSALQREPEAPSPPAIEPEPLPEPVPEDAPPPPPVPLPDAVEQEKVQRDAESPEVAEVAVEQEQKRTEPKQADLDSRQQTEQERQRQRQLADIRRQLDQARREADMAEMRARQLADARSQSATSTAPPRGDPNSRSAEDALYSVALKDAITRQWTRPESIPLGIPCQVRLRQIPGGEVVDVQVSAGCPYDELGKRSLEAAVLKASPLPYAGFENVFRRDVILTFRPEDVDDLRR